ncbi:hypothetical protein D3C77_661600 [compost metagenome]
MLERMSSQCRVVRFQVQLEVFMQAVFLQECDCCSRIEVVLVLGRLFWLRLDQELTCVADFFCIIESHLEESCQVVKLKTHIRIQ